MGSEGEEKGRKSSSEKDKRETKSKSSGTKILATGLVGIEEGREMGKKVKNNRSKFNKRNKERLCRERKWEDT